MKEKRAPVLFLRHSFWKCYSLLWFLPRFLSPDSSYSWPGSSKSILFPAPARRYSLEWLSIPLHFCSLINARRLCAFQLIVHLYAQQPCSWFCRSATMLLVLQILRKSGVRLKAMKCRWALQLRRCCRICRELNSTSTQWTNRAFWVSICQWFILQQSCHWREGDVPRATAQVELWALSNF